MKARSGDMNVTLSGNQLGIFFDNITTDKTYYIPPARRSEFLFALRRLGRNPELFFAALDKLEEVKDEQQ